LSHKSKIFNKKKKKTIILTQITWKRELDFSTHKLAIRESLSCKTRREKKIDTHCAYKQHKNWKRRKIDNGR
jgi:hypothetical protein